MSRDSLKSGRLIGSGIFLKQSKSVMDAVISNFRSVRVLGLHDLGMNEVPGSVSMLKHLIYIDLSENNFVTLPKSMSKMLNLQTLKLSYCFDLCELPKNIHKMVNIRHLDLDGWFNLSKMPCGIGKLTSLRTLSQFVIGQETSMSSKANVVLTELNGLVKLGGILRLRSLGCIECLCPKIDDVVLKNKEYLQSLRLEWTEEAVGDEYDEILLESLQQHKNLKLKALYIVDVRNLFLLPEGLQNLSLLDHLEINGCPNLSSIPIEGMQALTMLHFLHVHDCGLTSLSPVIKHLSMLLKH
ncbi:hypothetical protein P3S68_021317 [Capsicum galapagoense]